MQKRPRSAVRGTDVRGLFLRQPTASKGTMKLSLALGFNQMEVGGVHGALLSFPLPFLFGFSIMEING